MELHEPACLLHARTAFPLFCLDLVGPDQSCLLHARTAFPCAPDPGSPLVLRNRSITIKTLWQKTC
jgi:hypothetical protein